MTFPLLTGVALIQSTLLSRVSIMGARPNLMLLVVLIWAVVRGIDEGLTWAFFGGLLLDLLSGGPLASLALALLAAAYLAGQSLGEEVGSQAIRVVFLTVLGGTAYHVALMLLLDWSGHVVDWPYSLFRVAGPSILLNAAIAPVLLGPLSWLDRITREEGLAL